MIIILGTLFMMALGVDFVESLGAVIASIGNMGPGIGLTGPAYSWSFLPDPSKWFLSFLMLMGRLELFTILILFTPRFWENN
jgi:trk system potassium uptake protein TrkH